ncbi:site-specific integrase [Streptomyces sp. NPDC048641]|uniref:site-specific integrase n=1 Tax=Streptomyces sp. NPDC048641 TaxID=3154825 RepID=UPI003427F11D
MARTRRGGACALPTISPARAEGEPRLPAGTPGTSCAPAAFLAHARRTAPYLYDLCTALVTNGLRRGEALGLAFEIIDFTTRRLFVRRSLTTIDNNRLVWGAPKTVASASWIAPPAPWPPCGRRQRAIGRTTGLVFAQPDGSPPRPQQVLNDFREAAHNAGLRPIALKDLRHGTATLMITAGIPLVLVSELLRHTQLSTTADLYTHVTGPAAARAARTLDATLTRAIRTLCWHRLMDRLRPPQGGARAPHGPRQGVRTATRQAASPGSLRVPTRDCRSVSQAESRASGQCSGQSSVRRKRVLVRPLTRRRLPSPPSRLLRCRSCRLLVREGR